MPRGSSREAGGHLRTLFTLGVVGSLSDAQLVDRFVLQRDEMAFAALVERHGPMVLGVCRRVLRDRHDAEDAFQATFLVLARKAATLARRERLANWLYGVAFRTAKDARGRACRRQSHEREVMVRAGGGDPSDQAADHEDLRAVLDEELARLPDRLRVAVVLCELEGHSRSEAARRLGIPEGTLSSRLARARDLLRERLTNRGLAFSAGALALGMASGVEAGGVPAVLIESTVQAAARVAAGHTVGGVVSASVASLTEGVLKTMFLAKLKGIALGTLALGAVTAGAVLAQNPGSNSQPNAVTIVSVEEAPTPSEGPLKKPNNPNLVEESARVPPSRIVVGAEDLVPDRPIPVPTEQPIREVQPKQPQERLILITPDVKRVDQPVAPAVDRMAALESKLDRILNALERKSAAAADPITARLALVNSDSNPMPATDASQRAVPATQPAGARNRPAVPDPNREGPLASTVPAQRPRYTATRPAASVSQRLDDIEKRLDRLEKQLGGTPSGATAEASLGSPPSAEPFGRSVGLVR